MLSPAMEELASVLQKRASSDSAHLEAIKGHIENTSRNFADVTNILRESADHLNAIPRRIDEIAGTITDSARQGVGTGMAHVTDEFTRRLDIVVTGLERSAVIFSAASKGTENKEGDRGDTSADFVGTVQQAAQEMRRVSEESRKLVAVLQQIQLAQTDGSSKKGDGFFRRLWDR
jgi:septal ring factor EnvC (AmiA/AmiB activator)